jgi:pimeloyl-ACP methyl ester carboxylesterase
MEDQIRHALNQYQKNGGQAEELIVKNSGHTPFLEQPDEVLKALQDFLNKHNKAD